MPNHLLLYLSLLRRVLSFFVTPPSSPALVFPPLLRHTPAMMVVENTRLLLPMLRHGSQPPMEVARLYVTFCQGSRRKEELLEIFVAHGWGPSPPQSNTHNRRGGSTSSDTVLSEEKKSGSTHEDGDDSDSDECVHGEDFLLHAAVLEENEDMVEELLAQGEDPNALESSGYSPLTVAASHGSVAMVKVLLGAGASLELKNPEDGNTALHASAAEGRVEVTELLLAAALSNSSNKKSAISGSSARDTAPCSGKAKCGAPSSPPSRAAAANSRDACPPSSVVDAINDEGNRPLHLAASHNHVQVMEVLLGAGADVDSQDKDGGTALFYAAWNDNTEAVTALLKAGASPDIQNSSGYAALHVAMRRPAAGVVKALIAAGASPGVGGERGPTPLHFACESNARGTVEALLRAGAVPGHCWNDHLETPLYMACMCGSLNAVKLLLPHLSVRQINMRNRTLGLDEGGETPLVAAIWYEAMDEWEKIEIVEAVSHCGR